MCLSVVSVSGRASLLQYFLDMDTGVGNPTRIMCLFWQQKSSTRNNAWNMDMGVGIS
uniref:Uncharacterized protein n=1 Tax=Arundo donax TaxID=35708 RepID=A0A0A9HNT9_ARUDO